MIARNARRGNGEAYVEDGVEADVGVRIGLIPGCAAGAAKGFVPAGVISELVSAGELAGVMSVLSAGALLAGAGVNATAFEAEITKKRQIEKPLYFHKFVK